MTAPEFLTERQKAYREFLLSPFWLEKSHAEKEKAKSKCQTCDSPFHIQCHHLVYRDDLHDIRPGDLIVLCEPCHKVAHGIPLTKTQRKSRNRRIRNKLRREKREQRKLQFQRQKANNVQKPHQPSKSNGVQRQSSTFASNIKGNRGWKIVFPQSPFPNDEKRRKKFEKLKRQYIKDFLAGKRKGPGTKSWV